MRRLLGVFAAGCLAIGVAPEAHAVVLGFTGTLAIAGVVDPSTGVPVVASGTGVATVNGSGPDGHLTGLRLPANVFKMTAFLIPVTDPVVFPIAGLRLTGANASGVFAGVGGGGFSGAMPLNGTMKACLFGACSTTPPANLVVPLSVVGKGGAVATSRFDLAGHLVAGLTVAGAPWTTGTAAVGTLTAMGGVSPLSNTGARSGTLTLVTPIFISTNSGFGPSLIPSVGTLTMRFVPEPGTIVLLGSSIVGLVMIGRRRALA